jgi:hypothetical protein
MFPELGNLDYIIKKYNTAVNKESSNYLNLSVKQEIWPGFGDDGNLINESSLGKTKVPGPNANYDLYYVKARTIFIQL